MIFLFIVVLAIIVVSLSVIVAKNKKKTETNKFFSITSIIEKLTLLSKRFIPSTLLVIGLNLLFVISIEKNTFDAVSYQLWIFFSAGIFISTTVSLFVEDFLNYLKTNLVSLLSILIWGVYCFFLPEKGSDIPISKGIEIGVITGVAFLAMFFISFLKNNKDRAFWNFSGQILLQILLSFLFSTILFQGLSLAAFAIESLFNIPFNADIYTYLALFCFALLSPIYILANIPNKAEKNNTNIFYNKIQKVLALYILSPILGVYTLILYSYLIKIIVTWELPNGWVSWLVSALALGGLLVIALLYPIREQKDNKVANLFSRWLNLLILPLLILMTIGILRRISDYSITINRAYILLLNIWFYGIYIYLFITKWKHLKWILISLVGIAFISSISIWSVSNLTKNILSKEITTILPQQVSFKDARASFYSKTQEEQKRIESVLLYLHKHFGKESLQSFFTDTVSDSRWDFLSDVGLNLDNIASQGEYIGYYANEQSKVWEINNYNTFVDIDFHNYATQNEEDEVHYAVNKDTLKILVHKQTFSIPIKDIALEYSKSEDKKDNKQKIVIQEKNYTLIINHFNSYYYDEQDSLNLTQFYAYLFYNTANDDE